MSITGVNIDGAFQNFNLTGTEIVNLKVVHPKLSILMDQVANNIRRFIFRIILPKISRQSKSMICAWYIYNRLVQESKRTL